MAAGRHPLLAAEPDQRQNVGQLQEVWRFQTGDLKTANDPGEITNEVTPIKIRDTLYMCTPHQKLFALDAATGKKMEV